MVLYTIVGYTGCGHYDRAVKCGQTLVANHPEEVKLKLKGTGKDEFLEYLHLQHKGLQHFTSPAVWKGTPENGEFIGGADDFEAHAKEYYPVDASINKLVVIVAMVLTGLIAVVMANENTRKWH